jgi:hypothetical protein
MAGIVDVASAGAAGVAVAVHPLRTKISKDATAAAVVTEEFIVRVHSGDVR